MTNYRGRSAESNALSLSNLFKNSFHGAKPSSSMFLILILWVGMTSSSGRNVRQNVTKCKFAMKTFYAALPNELIFGI